MMYMDFVDEFYADQDLSLLKKLTVVIPTYNRNYYLSRCLWYHSHFPFGEIIVADSSPEEKKAVNRETVRKLAEEHRVNIRYLEYPPDTERYGRDIMRKWADAVQHVETEYSQICTDKEFLVPMTLCKCIAFLDEHDDYNMAAGPRYDLNSSKFGDIGLFEAFPGGSSIEYSDPLARLLVFSISRSDTSNVSSLRRSHIHKHIYNKLFESGINDLRFGEFGLELLSVISSKSIYSPNEPQIYRDNVQSSLSLKMKHSTSESSTTRYPWLDEYVQNGLYTEYMDRLCFCLTHEYLVLSSGSSTMTVQDVNKLMSTAIVNLQKIRGFFGGSQSQILRCGRLILNYLPIRISTGILNRVLRLLNRPALSLVTDTPNEFPMIAQIIMKTLYLHKKDEPLPLVACG